MSVIETLPLKYAPDSALGVSITAGGAAWTYGPWVEVVSSAPAGMAVAGIFITGDGAVESEVEVGVGAASLETGIGSFRQARPLGNTTTHDRAVFLPIPLDGISTGNRVSVRIRHSASSGTFLVTLIYYEGYSGDTLSDLGSPQLGTDGVTLTPSGTPWTFTPWAELAPGTAILPTTDLTAHWDASDASDLYDTIVGTPGVPTGAVTDGEQVGAWVSKVNTDHVWRPNDSVTVFQPTDATWENDNVLTLPSVKFNEGTFEAVLASNGVELETDDFMTASNKTLVFSFLLDAGALLADNASVYLNTVLIGNGKNNYFGTFLRNDSGTIRLYAYNWDGTADQVSAVITAGEKYIVMVRHFGGNLYLTVRSVSTEVTASTASGNTTDITGGAAVWRMSDSNSGGTEQFKGRIGEVAIYDVGLTGVAYTRVMSYFDRWLYGDGIGPRVIYGLAFTDERVGTFSQCQMEYQLAIGGSGAETIIEEIRVSKVTKGSDSHFLLPRVFPLDANTRVSVRMRKSDSDTTPLKAALLWYLDEVEVNHAPVVNAGPNQTMSFSGGGVLAGSVSDDGLPDPPATVTILWTVVSGPGTLTFDDDTDPTTGFTVDMPGTYVLELSADDSELVTTDQVTLIFTDIPILPMQRAGYVLFSNDIVERQTETRWTKSSLMILVADPPAGSSPAGLTLTEITGDLYDQEGNVITFGRLSMTPRGPLVVDDQLIAPKTVIYDITGSISINLAASNGTLYDVTYDPTPEDTVTPINLKSGFFADIWDVPDTGPVEISDL